MDKLSKTQKDEFATAFAMLALYDGGVSTFLSRHGEIRDLHGGRGNTKRLKFLVSIVGVTTVTVRMPKLARPVELSKRSN